MIYVDRARVPAPEALRSEAVRKALSSAEDHVRARDARSRQSLHSFAPLHAGPTVIRALGELFRNTCAFCESPVHRCGPGNVHHFRPLEGAADPRTGVVSREHYWWLAYDWDNLYLACDECRRAAGARFPVDGRRARVGLTGSRLRAERSLVLDPCHDVPETSLAVLPDGTLVANDERGELTIETFALNRPGLVEARRTEPRGELPRLEAAPRRAARRHAPSAGLPPYVRRVAIRNFRAIEQLELEFPEEPGAWTMLLGDNGDGKTSVLQALAVAFMDPRQRRRLKAAEFLRDGAADGDIAVEFHDRGGEVRVWFDAAEGRFHASGGRPAVVAGYGAYRLPARSAKRTSGAPPRVASVLDPHEQLVAPEPWLLGLTQPAFDAAARALKRLLVDDESVLHRVKGEVRFVRRDTSLPLDQLRAGARSMIALAVDLMSYVMTRWDTLEAAEGVVLIDEIGAHLHPRWQMRVVSGFREAFPRMQFVATTHDPLCLRGLHDGEVVVLRRDERQRIYADTDLPSVEGLDVDQLLTSEHFGLGSTLDPEIEARFEEYYALLAKHRPTKKDQARIDELRTFLAGYRQFGRTERERMVLEAADEALARKRSHPREGTRAALTDEAKERIVQLWTEAGL